MKFLRKAISLMAAAVLAASVASTQVLAESTDENTYPIYIVPSVSAAAPGDIISIKVCADTTAKVCALTFDIIFDSTAFEYQSDSVKKGSSVSDWSLNAGTKDASSGKVIINLLSEKPVTDKKSELIEASFKVLKPNGAMSIVLDVVADVNGNDVTNLFSVSGVTVKCSHKNTETKTVIEDCENGGSTVTACKDCGETVKTENIAPTEHKVAQWTETKKATCAKKGEEEGVCTVCGKTFTRETEMVDHSYGEWEVTTPAACTKKGIETSTCSVCGNAKTREIDALGHDFGEWTAAKAATCTEKGTEERACSRCDEKETRETDMIDHAVEWAVTKEATCTEAGEKTGTCTACGNKVTETIPAAGHAFGEWITVKEATETEMGSEERECSVCGEKETKEIPVKTKPSVPIYDNNYNTDITTVPESSESDEPAPDDDNTVTTAPEDSTGTVTAPESSTDSKPAPDDDNTVTAASEAINGGNTSVSAPENNTYDPADDNNVDTGAGGIAAISGLVAISAAAVIIAKKRK